MPRVPSKFKIPRVLLTGSTGLLKGIRLGVHLSMHVFVLLTNIY